MFLTSFTFAAADPGRENWHNKGRNTSEAAEALKAELIAKGFRCGPVTRVLIEHPEPDTFSQTPPNRLQLAKAG